jgi:regulatory protein
MAFSKLDDELTQSDATKPTDKPADIRLAAMNLLARREHSVRELRMKLSRRFTDEPMVVCELQRLAKENLQSDQRFAQSYAHQRAGAGFGPLRVRQEMRDRGLSDGDVSEAFEAEALDWNVIAAQAYSKKYGHSDVREVLELKEQARRSRFMQYRGFTAEHYQHLVQP